MTAVPSSEPTVPNKRRKVAAWSTWAIVALSVILVVLVALSLWRYFADHVEPQLYDVGGIPITEEITMPAGTDPAIVTLTMQSINEEDMELTIDVSSIRSCPDPTCEPFSVLLYGLPGDRQSWTAGKRVAIAVPAGVGPFDGDALLPVGGRPELFPFDEYEIRLGMSIATVDDRGIERPLTIDQIEERGIRFVFADLVDTMETRSVTRFDPAKSPTEIKALGLGYAMRFSMDRPNYVAVQTVMMLCVVVATMILTVLRKSFDQLIVGTTGVVIGVYGMRSFLIQTKYSGLTIVSMTLAIVTGIGVVLIVTRIALHLSRRSPQQQAELIDDEAD